MKQHQTVTNTLPVCHCIPHILFF